MKKVLSTVAALGLVAGLASTAAAVEFKMSGKYLVEGAYLSDARGTGLDVTEAAVENTPTDAYFLHTFEIKPTMKVNDKVSMTSVIRLADDTIWGGQAEGDVNSTGSKVNDTTGDMYVHQLYMDYASPIGNTRFGRTPAGTYGTNFMDSDKRADRVMVWPTFLPKPFSTLFYLEKGTDTRGTNNVLTDQSDADSTKYVARLYFNTDSVDAGVHYAYGRNMSDSFFTVANGYTLGTDTGSDVKHELTVYGKYKIDNFFINGELTHYFGEVDLLNNTAAKLDRDYDSWAAQLQAGVKLDALTVSVMGFYAQGQDRNATLANGGDIENALGTTGTGDQFEPLYILTGRHTGMLNNDIFSGSTSTLSTAGVQAGVVGVDYAVSNQLSLHGAIGYAKADEERIAGQDKAYGFEYNVGAAYKLLDNLTYEAHFGYLDTGDFFKSTTTLNDSQTENVYILTHSLTMTF